MLKNNVFNSTLIETLHDLLNPESFFFVKNKHGTPPSYDSIDASDSSEGNNNNQNNFTLQSSTFPYVIDLLEEFGLNGGFGQINKYFSLLSNISEVAKFLQIFSNSIHFLTVSSFYLNVPQIISFIYKFCSQNAPNTSLR